MVVLVGVTVEEDEEDAGGVEEDIEWSLDDEAEAFGDEGVDMGTNELAGLAKRFWPGPITCWKV
jgi:hypothetical protein